MVAARRVAVLGGVLLGGVALVALGVVFVAVGLDKASEISGVIGAVAGVAGLGLSGYGIVLARRQPPGVVTAGAGSQVVSGSVIAGDNIQIGQARDVHLRDE